MTVTLSAGLAYSITSPLPHSPLLSSPGGFEWQQSHTCSRGVCFNFPASPTTAPLRPVISWAQTAGGTGVHRVPSPLPSAFYTPSLSTSTPLSVPPAQLCMAARSGGEGNREGSRTLQPCPPLDDDRQPLFNVA